jgi:hypothetical protein
MSGHEGSREDAICSHLVPTRVPTLRAIGALDGDGAVAPRRTHPRATAVAAVAQEQSRGEG